MTTWIWEKIARRKTLKCFCLYGKLYWNNYLGKFCHVSKPVNPRYRVCDFFFCPRLRPVWTMSHSVWNCNYHILEHLIWALPVPLCLLGLFWCSEPVRRLQHLVLKPVGHSWINGWLYSQRSPINDQLYLSQCWQTHLSMWMHAVGI